MMQLITVYRSSRPLQLRRPLAEQVIGQHQGHHGLGHGHNSGRYGRVVPAFDLDLRRLAAGQINCTLLLGDGRRGLDGNGADDGRARGYAAQDATGVVALKLDPVRPRQSRGSFISLPRMPAHSRPAPISTAFTAPMLMSAFARSASSLSKTGSPRPAGTPDCGYYYYPAQAVSLRAHAVQPLQHPLCGSGIGAANCIGLGLGLKLQQI